MPANKETEQVFSALDKLGLGDQVDITQMVRAWPSQYIPVLPTPLQLAFCCLPSLEVFYGGALGGGKSEAMLMAALQYVEVPGYSAIIFRKSFADLSRRKALLDRAAEWLGPHLGKTVKYQPLTRSFHFPSGATLAFGYMGTKGAHETIQGAEYQFIGIDEVTQHLEDDAMYANTRCRKTHDMDCPLRIRWTGNPGGIGHAWVKKYYGITKNPAFNPTDGYNVGDHFFAKNPMFIGKQPEGRIFLPARLVDNPYIDKEEYIPALKNIDPITKAQLLDGDWDASPNSRFKKEWFPRYKRNGEYIIIGGESYLAKNTVRFATVDVAASVREGVGEERFHTRGGSREAAMPCYTVISSWMIVEKFLVLIDVKRMQVEAPDIFNAMRRVGNEFNIKDFIVEANGVGRPVAQVGVAQGLPIREIWTVTDKIQNSYSASVLAQQGRIVLPHESLEHPWLEDFEAEIFTWMGHPDETSDQIDTMSTAAKEAQSMLTPSDPLVPGSGLVPRVGHGKTSPNAYNGYTPPPQLRVGCSPRQQTPYKFGL